ncbi:MAG: hypothetical protein N2746_02230 [Deltaproteobacteria bacterium]|nr:hypothetical protein [Deltaproteobacteria bacterium]
MKMTKGHTYIYISSALSFGSSLYTEVLAAKPPLLFWLGAIIHRLVRNEIIIFKIMWHPF